MNSSIVALFQTDNLRYHIHICLSTIYHDFQPCTAKQAFGRPGLIPSVPEIDLKCMCISYGMLVRKMIDTDYY